MTFVYRNIIVICILVFAGVALFLLVAQPAQKKKKALMQQQLGGFFRTELTKAFGPEPEPATLPIDWAYLEAAKLSVVSFTECTVTDFHEGEHKGLRFSAANVELRRTVEEKSGPNNDNWITRTETLFRGIVVRCKDICDPALDIALNDMFQERKKDDITEPAAFRKHFSAHTADDREADDQVTPQLRDLVQKLEASSRTSKLCGLILRDGDLALAEHPVCVCGHSGGIGSAGHRRHPQVVHRLADRYGQSAGSDNGKSRADRHDRIRRRIWKKKAGT